MSQWADRIRNHQVWQQLTALGPAIDQARVREEVDSTTLDGLERLRAVLAFVGKRLATADPFTTHVTPLEGIAAALRDATAEIQAFTADGSPGRVVNANAHADTALQNLGQVATPGTPEELAALKDAATAYRASLEEQLQHAGRSTTQLRSDTDAVKAKVTEIGTEITTERQRLSQLTSEFQSQFSSAQEVRSKDFAETQAARQEKFSALMADYTQRLTEQNADFVRQKELALSTVTRKSANVFRRLRSVEATGGPVSEAPGPGPAW